MPGRLGARNFPRGRPSRFVKNATKSTSSVSLRIEAMQRLDEAEVADPGSGHSYTATPRALPMIQRNALSAEIERSLA